VLLQQASNESFTSFAIGFDQPWKEIVFLVPVMVFSGGIEVADDVRRRLPRLGIHAYLTQMAAETVQQLTALLDPIVTGSKHFQRVVEIRRSAPEQSISS
jgi:hypothetical protein